MEIISKNGQCMKGKTDMCASLEVEPVHIELM